MLAPSRAFSHCAERGAAVIMAMLTVALVVSLSAAVLAEFGASVESVSGRHDLAQARWLARGTIDWARNVLADDKRTTGAVDYVGESWSVKMSLTAVEEGDVSGEIDDISGRFNLNAVITDKGEPRAAGIAAFARLLQQAGGLSQAVANNQASVLADWVRFAEDATKKSPSESSEKKSRFAAPLPIVDELVNVPGFSASTVERLRPFIAALPPESRLNLNCATAEVLFASLGSITMDQAQGIVSDRAKASFKDLVDFNQRYASRYKVSADPLLHTTGSRFFLASGRARFGTATTRIQALLDRSEPDNHNNLWPSVVWQRIL